MMCRVQDAVHDRIAQVEVRGRHVDLGPQHAGAIRELTVAHPLEQIQVLVDTAIAKRAAGSGLRKGAAHLAYLVGALVVDVCLAGPYQLLSPFVQLPEIVRGVEQAVLPVKAQPFDVGYDRIDVLDLFFRRVRVVKAKVALAAVLLRNTEIQADRLCVPYVQIAVRLWRKPRVYLPAKPSATVVLLNDFAHEIDTFSGLDARHLSSPLCGPNQPG